MLLPVIFCLDQIANNDINCTIIASSLRQLLVRSYLIIAVEFSEKFNYLILGVRREDAFAIRWE